MRLASVAVAKLAAGELNRLMAVVVATEIAVMAGRDRRPRL